MASRQSGVFQRLVVHGFPIVVAALALLACAAPAQAGTVYVSTSGNDTNDGLSWATAKLTVQAGLNTAVSTDQVWVAAGTYVENITLKAGVALYGGFVGSETNLSQRNWVTNKTTLDGNQAGSVVISPASTSVTTRIDGFTIRNGNGDPDRSYRNGGGIHCLDSSPTIANNTITANTLVTSVNGYGGGVFCFGGSPTITNNTITGNTIAGLNGYGGGIYCLSCSPTITNNTIAGNIAGSQNSLVGGGIMCISSSAMIANTVVAFNSSGIYTSGSSTLTLRHNCVFGNTAYNYSGLADPTGMNGNISADPKLASVAYGNVHIQPDSPCRDAGDDAVVKTDWLDFDGEARIQGSHVDIGADESDGTLWPDGPSVIVRVSSNGNDANDGSSWALAKRTVQAGIDAAAFFGGEVWVQAGTYDERITLHPFTYVYGGFSGTESTRDSRDWVVNVTVLDGQQGGSVVTARTGHQVSRIDGFTIRNGIAAGIYCQSSSPVIANNTITGNIGGGIDCDSSFPTIIDNRIIGNTASAGGGVSCCFSSPTIANNTIAGNTASSGGGIYCYYSFPTIVNTVVAFNSSGIYKGGLGALTLRYNCVFGNPAYNYSRVTDPTGTSGNISADPKLVGVAYGNVHIQPDSPCRDAGDDSMVQADWLDIDGQARIQGSHVDIGADESDGTVWPGGPNVVVRVSPQGDDANDGSSWSLAKRTVQAGINTASVLGGEVWVQTGTYYERITLPPFVHLYGGFVGTENAGGERNWAANTTILDGLQGGSVVTFVAGYRLSAIDGFTIRNGRSQYGGGISCRFSSPMIANNTISDNRAFLHGGGIYCSSSSPLIANNTITGDSAGDGSGIYCDDGSSPTIANNTITSNNAQRGGGICCSYDCSPIIANNTITGNNAADGGGIYFCSPPAMIANNIVAFNSSGLYHAGLDAPILRSNCVYGNTAYNYSRVTDPTGTSGNISADPKLAGVAYGNMHIQPDSPCRNAGDDSMVQADWLDMDAQSRIIGAHADIGADESDGTVWAAGPYVIVRVSPEGDDTHDGSSWALAKRTVQAGIDAASALGGEVWVRAGTYPERITLLLYAHVYGGFAGTEDAREERNWTAHPTILDAEQGGPVVTAKAGFHLSTIDGFTIRNGKGIGGGGGGIDCFDGSPTIANNTITGNSATSGGGIYCRSWSSPIIANNTIAGNLAAYGGGIDSSAGSPTIANNTITGNTAYHSYGGGGGIDCFGGFPTIANNTIVGNVGSLGGGVYCKWSSPTIANNIIAFNSSGVYQESGSGTPLLLSDCVFGNTSYNYSGMTDPTGTNGNISADPLLIRLANPGPDGTWGTPDDDYGDLRLASGSPCIDAGDNAAVPADVLDLDGDGDITEPMPFDLLGGPRFLDDTGSGDTGSGTPPIVDMGAYEHVPVPAELQSSLPADGESLWRSQKNTIRLFFDQDVEAPAVGVMVIWEMLEGGTYGGDLSAGFTFTIENDAQSRPRILKIRETGSTLTHRKWYAVANTGSWTGVSPFVVQYVVQVGDANNDGRVLNTDFGVINAGIPIFKAADDDRRDINGDGRVLNTDFGVTNSKIPSFPVAKPSGH